MYSQQALRVSSPLLSLGVAFLAVTSACSDEHPTFPSTPTQQAQPLARWSDTPRIRDGVSYRVLERRDPLYMAAPSESGRLLSGSEATAKLAQLGGNAGPVMVATHGLAAASADPVGLFSRSDVIIDHTVANFFTTATINVLTPDNYRLGQLRKEVNHTVGMRGGTAAAPFSRSRALQAQRGVTMQTHTTAWPGIDMGTTCPVSATERAALQLSLDRVIAGPLMMPESRDASSTASNSIERACFDSPGDFCNTLNYCGDNDSDGSPPPVGGSGAGTAVSGPVYGPTLAGWQNRYCWVTDWYDSERRYIGTTVDWCSL